MWLKDIHRRPGTMVPTAPRRRPHGRKPCKSRRRPFSSCQVWLNKENHRQVWDIESSNARKTRINCSLAQEFQSGIINRTRSVGTSFRPHDYPVSRKFAASSVICPRCRHWMPKPKSAGHRSKRHGPSATPNKSPRRTKQARQAINRRHHPSHHCEIGCVNTGSSL